MIMQPHLVTGASFRRQCRDPIDIAQVAILLDVDGTIPDVAATELGPLINTKMAAIPDRATADKLQMLCGQPVIEIKPPGFNKGIAVRELLQIPPFAQRIPLFVGDGVTDELVFAALPALGGFGCSVGREVAGVEGTFDGPQGVRDWLSGLCGREGMKSG
jgi:trehalose-phosphatase